MFEIDQLKELLNFIMIIYINAIFNNLIYLIVELILLLCVFNQFGKNMILYKSNLLENRTGFKCCKLLFINSLIKTI